VDYSAQLATPFAGAEIERWIRVEQRLSSSPFLADPLRRLRYDCSEGWAWDNYRPLVLALARMLRREGRPARVLEVGGGRGPLFSVEQALSANIHLTVNDADARELSLGPEGFEHACFNIAGDIDPKLAGTFDLIISRMVMEHVKDAPRAWANMRELLRPGGVAFAFHPTLFGPPFVVNWLMPERASARVLRMVFPNRHDTGYPKFPARYEMCRTDPTILNPIFSRCGFTETLIAPIWGHGYFRALPGIRELDQLLFRAAEARDWRGLTTYSYTLARR
jgi:SAM-dependent methyltransferase